MKASNALIVIGVVVLVGGVAWFRSAREGSNAGTSTPTASPAVADPVPSPTSAPAKEGELCPEPPPAANAGATPSRAPAAAQKLPRVVDLGADKCIPCKKLAPILAELKKEYAGRVVVEFIDVWKDPQAGEPYKIRVIPTQVFFDAEAKEVWRHEGFLPKADFIAKFAELGVK
jgi:thioredoxin 1